MMPTSEPSTGPSPAVDELVRRLGEFQTRLDRIENYLGLERSAATPPGDVERVASGSPAAALPDAAMSAALIGKSLLGLALAYLLRAMTESQVAPAGYGAALGIAYAVAWLVAAARTPPASTFRISLRALTSVLILAPLLWEVQMRFHAISSWWTAGVLASFSLFGLAISWRKNLTTIAWITSLGSLLTILALFVSSRDLLPFMAALLAMAAGVEVSALMEHWLGERWIVAIAADLAVLHMTWLATGAGGLPEGYAALSRPELLGAQVTLVLIYLASTIARTFGRGFQITSFEVAQGAFAIIVSTTGALRVAEGHPAAILATGLFCTFCAAACYVVCLAFLERHAEKNRNFQVYSAFGLLLAITGSWLLVSVPALVLAWCALAICFTVLGRRSGRLTLKWHAACYLLLAAIVSGTAERTISRFLTSSGHTGAEITDLFSWAITLASLACYVVLARDGRTAASNWQYPAVSLVVAALAALHSAGLLAGALHPLCRSVAGVNAADYCPVVLTGTLFVTSITVALCELRSPREDLAWLAYVFLAVATLKLMVQDLRQDSTLAIVLSLLLYGGFLIVVPRLLQRAKVAAGQV